MAKKRKKAKKPPFTKKQIAYIEALILRHEVKEREEKLANNLHNCEIAARGNLPYPFFAPFLKQLRKRSDHP